MAGIGDSGVVGSVATGLASEAGSETVKDNLGGLGSNNEGEKLPAVRGFCRPRGTVPTPG